MGIETAIIASAVGTLGAGAMSASAAKKAGKTQARAAEAGTAAQLQMFREQQRSMAPWRETGARALDVYSGMLGIPQAAPTAGYLPQQQYGASQYMGGGDYLSRGDRFGDMGPGADRGGYIPQRRTMGQARPVAQLQGDVTQAQPSFQQMLELYPSYRWQMEEGMGDIQRQAAARGLLQSGRTLKGLQQYKTGLLGQMSESYLNRLASLSGVGQTTSAQMGQMGMKAGAQQAAGMQQAAQARASGYLGKAQAWGGALSGLGQLAGYASGGFGGTAPTTPTVTSGYGGPTPYGYGI